MLKIKILDVKDLSFAEEESLVNNTIEELENIGYSVCGIQFRQRSVIIEYFKMEDFPNEDYRCKGCACDLQNTEEPFDTDDAEIVSSSSCLSEYSYQYDLKNNIL